MTVITQQTSFVEMALSLVIVLVAICLLLMLIAVLFQLSSGGGVSFEVRKETHRVIVEERVEPSKPTAKFDDNQYKRLSGNSGKGQRKLYPPTSTTKKVSQKPKKKIAVGSGQKPKAQLTGNSSRVKRLK